MYSLSMAINKSKQYGDLLLFMDCLYCIIVDETNMTRYAAASSISSLRMLSYRRVMSYGAVHTFVAKTMHRVLTLGGNH